MDEIIVCMSSKSGEKEFSFPLSIRHAISFTLTSAGLKICKPDRESNK